MFESDAFGPFSTSAQAETLRSAGWNPNGDPFTRPYELRHNVGIALSDAGVDLADISPMLGHKDLHTTRRTYVPIRQARMQRASEAIDGRFSAWDAPTVPAEVPASSAQTPRNRHKSAQLPKPLKMGLKGRKPQGKSRRKTGGSA